MILYRVIVGILCVVGFIAFFPIGLALLPLLFFPVRKGKRMDELKIVGSVFLVLYIVGCIFFKASEPEEDIVTIGIGLAFILWIPGLIFFIVGNAREKRKLEKQHIWYHQAITMHGVRSVPALAQMAGLSVQQVADDLKEMIRTQKLFGATIDETAGTIHLFNDQRPNVAGGNDMGRNNAAMNNVATNNAGANVWGGTGFVRRTETVTQTQTQTQSQTTTYYSSNGVGPAPGVGKESAPRTPVNVNCKGCGASAQVYPGENKQCEYCGSLVQ